CGDAGHILLSSTSADLLLQMGGWDAYLHDLGECVIKHGKRLHLFSLHTDEVGNPERPARLQAFTPQEQAPAPSSSTLQMSAGAPAPAGGQSVAILYKRNVEPDGYVLDLLEKELTASGCEVFVDRHMSIGIEWATEIERQIREADAVIPLLSAASVQSE